jgi:branched-subunit amino acid aminotransferase/4-amino-4-deoxychorismate lyase
MHLEILPPATSEFPAHGCPGFPSGLLFGYSVYTTFRWPLSTRWLHAHLDRLEQHATFLRLDWPFPKAWLVQQFEEALQGTLLQQQASPSEQLACRLTACADVEGYGDFYAPDVTHSKETEANMAIDTPSKLPTRLFLSTRSLPPTPGIGLRLKTIPYQRPLPQIKTGAMAESILLKRQAQSEGFDDLLFINPNGACSEASTSNIFLVRDDALFTPEPQRDGCLPGITRLQVLEAASILGISAFDTQPLSLPDIRNAQALFLTNAAQGIIPARSIDDYVLPWPDSSQRIVNTLVKALSMAL